MNKSPIILSENKVCMAFVPCGYPDLTTTKATILALDEQVDLIALGIPFSDPTAQTPTAQLCNNLALEQGVTTDHIFSLLSTMKDMVSTPLLLNTYANLVFSYGPDCFLQKAAETGIRGLLLQDVPMEEQEEFRKACHAHHIALISVVTTTSGDRIPAILSNAEGFLYGISAIDLSQSQIDPIQQTNAFFDVIHKQTELPVVLATHETQPQVISPLAEHADGIFLTDAIACLLQAHQDKAPSYIVEYIKTIREAF